jgi:hypothetical protein
MFNAAQTEEIRRHAWLEMEKIYQILAEAGLSFADIADGFGKSEDEIIGDLGRAFQLEWIHMYAGAYRQRHWETVHPMPEEANITWN